MAKFDYGLILVSLSSVGIFLLLVSDAALEEGLINQSLNNQISEQISLSGIKVAYQV